MRKGGWIRKIVWGLALLLVIAVTLALTARYWMLPATRALIATRGVHVKSLAWEGVDSIKATGIQIDRPNAEVRIDTLTSFTPKAWKRALAALQTGANEPPVFLTINGWKIIPKKTTNTNSETIASQLRAFQGKLETFRQNCPRAVFLNGFIQHQKGEFRSGAIEWKNGVLDGNFTWPGLNDPADFKLTRTNLIVRQLALEIGSRINLQQTNENMRVAGYVRWKTNRLDLDLTFTPTNNVPIHSEIRSKGLKLPGHLFGLPQIEQISPQFTAAITNGQISVRVAEIGESIASP